MTEITVKIDVLPLIAAILLAPPVATLVLTLPTLLFLPVAFLALLIAIVSIGIGYVSYLLLAGPLMALAHWLGGDHPLLHAGIGLGAVALIPAAHAAGLPGIADPDTVGLGTFFGPIWCAASAMLYNKMRHEFELLEDPS